MMSENPREHELDSLWAQYRDASAPPEISRDFMPRLWARIEAQRTVSLSFRRLTRALVMSAAAFCLVMSGLLLMSSGSDVFTQATYVDVLDEAQETVAYTGAAIDEEL